jgi:hypothetical protein
VKHLLHPEADEEFAQAVNYFSPNLGRRFYREMERLFLGICENPEHFRQFDPPARRNLSRSFPYAVVFIDNRGVIWIVAVMHMKRLPGCWRD